MPLHDDRLRLRHNDPSEEPELVATTEARADLSRERLQRIMCENSARSYGL
jgi:hypothetical protein